MARSKTLSVLLVCLSGIACSGAEPRPAQVAITKSESGFRITLDGALFTEFVTTDQKSFLYPVIGPTGVKMTRDYPIIKDVPGESQDHPWQVGVFYTHGAVNGLDFWNERTDEHANARIELVKVVQAENLSPEQARLIVSQKWTHNQKTLMTDRTEITFSGNDSRRIIDYKITLIASHGEVVLGDTKEGAMAMRMNHKFRVNDQGAQALNSEGITGKDVWGKKARWVSYYNEIEGENQGITFFDHPTNLHYPTTWHARDYGLLGANPFGLSHFMPKQGMSGETVLKPGQSLTFSHRLIFHRGSPQETHIDQLHADWIQR